MLTLTALLVVLGGKPSDHAYPLAAALVVDGKVILVDVEKKTATPIDVGDIAAEEADLSPDKSTIAFNGLRGGEKQTSIFLYRFASKAVERVELPTKGSARFPRFSPTGEWLQFSAAALDAPGGSNNPGQIYRRRTSDGRVELVKTDEKLCHFSPIEVSPTSLAYVETPCMLDFRLKVTDTKTGASKSLASASAANSELATSLDRKTLLFTQKRVEGLGFYALREGSDQPAFVASVPIDRNRVQPRFVCPKDVVFYTKGSFKLLDSKSGAVTEIVKYPLVNREGRLQ